MTTCRNFLCWHHSTLEPSGCVEICDLKICTRRKAFERIMSVSGTENDSYEAIYAARGYRLTKELEEAMKK